MQLVGAEPISFELDGHARADDARNVVPRQLELDSAADGTVPVRLLVLEMKGIHVAPLGAASSDYFEALWRVGVRHRGAPAWFSPACDIDKKLARWLAKSLVRYQTRAAAITIDDAHFAIRRGGTSLVARFGAQQSELAPPAASRLLITGTEALYIVPWRDTIAPWRARLDVAIEADELSTATIGTIAWAPHGILSHDRPHRCGVATPLR